MAAALLIGTNAWGQFKIGTTPYSNLQAAINAASAGATTEIDMTSSYSGNDVVWLGTANVNDPAKHIILNMNGFDYEYTGLKDIAIAITHGRLEIKSNSESTISTESAKQELVRMYGTYQEVDPKNSTPFAHLYVGENVELISSKKNVLSVDVMRPGQPALFSKTDSDIKYACDFFHYEKSTDGWGVANGVRIDVYGKITSEVKYGIKVNGCVRYVKDYVESGTTFKTHYPVLNADYEPKYNGGAKNGNYTITSANGEFAPYVYIAPSGQVSTSSSAEEAVAAYSSGFAHWRIEGYCGGSTGLYVKSGQVEVANALIESTNTTHKVPTGKSSGVDAGGSAIVVESNASYSGSISVTISGDTKVQATSGYAIEEKITTAPTTEVVGISLEGGTFQGGSAGAMIIEDETKTEGKISVLGGTYDGTVNTTTLPNINVETLIPGYSEAHATEVPLEDKTVVVVSIGKTPESKNTWADVAALSNPTDRKNAKWTGTESGAAITTGAIYLGELQLISGTENNPQVLTINSDAELNVTNLIMNDYAQIIVEDGGKLIVVGQSGIMAPVADNIILESSEAKQAILLFHPNVTSNRHPMATVLLTSKGYHAPGKFIYQRFGVPAYSAKANEGAVYRGGDGNRVEFTVPSAFYYVDYAQANDPWKVMANEDAFVPFQCYEVTCGATEPGTVYTFKCPLMGNSNYALPIYSEWNYYANSYMAPIDIKELLSDLSNASKVDGTIYVYRSSDNWWDDINMMNFTGWFGGATAAQTQIDPMQAFIFRSKAGDQDALVNYEEHIYNPIVNPTGAAPARNHGTVGTAMIEIAAADGAKDQIYLVEDNMFSADYDNGYDAAKYMNNESFNLFASAEDAQMSKVATDNLEGTTLSMTTKDQTSFTMTFNYVNGINYAVRDNLTGTETEIAEGATYMFSVPANANVEGRFEIVPVAKMPTAIENVEATAASKGIYTVTGLFMGNDYHSLPNGIYVIDGKKIVK